MGTKTFETTKDFLFVVEHEGKEKEYRFSKSIPEEETKEEYIEKCKFEAELLAVHETDLNINEKEIISG